MTIIKANELLVFEGDTKCEYCKIEITKGIGIGGGEDNKFPTSYVCLNCAKEIIQRKLDSINLMISENK